DQVRFRWGLGPEGAEPVIIGFDVIIVDDHGRIEDVRGFLDRVPASA
ncbi:nuclear transport factor 2 family protein, partial [Burkholderia multivorans]